MNTVNCNFPPERSRCLEAIERQRVFDVAVLGGGIHGASVAQLAAFNGCSTVLFERQDYAAETSSRSSKMAHGGLRYLEYFDCRQVFEGIRARERLFDTAPHLVKPREFLIPVFENQLLYKAKLKAGLILYDLAVTRRDRRHRWIGADEIECGELFDRLRQPVGGFCYTDGLMNDARLVLDFIVSARSFGALCVNYIEGSVRKNGTSLVRIKWQDRLSEISGEVSARVVFNCAGPWIDRAGNNPALKSLMRFSIGSHLLFKRQWSYRPLLLPLKEKGRYYFIWPHPAGTLVGTTELETEDAPCDAKPSGDEVKEILSRIKRDLPESGLDRESLHYCYAGVRTLRARKRRRALPASNISRRPVWIRNGRTFSLIGGKFTTAVLTAEKGFKKALAALDIKTMRCTSNVLLPGAENFKDAQSAFHKLCKLHSIPEEIESRIISNMGSHAAVFYKDKSEEEVERNFRVTGGVCLFGELDYTVRFEQAETLEDIMRRRLGLEYYAGSGLEGISEIAQAVSKIKPELPWEKEVERYRARIEETYRVLGKTQKIG